MRGKIEGGWAGIGWNPPVQTRDRDRPSEMRWLAAPCKLPHMEYSAPFWYAVVQVGCESLRVLSQAHKRDQGNQLGTVEVNARKGGYVRLVGKGGVRIWTGRFGGV